MYTLLQDLRFTLRQLRKNLGFTLTAVLTLALGIGATTGIFSLVNAVLLRPLPFPQPDRLMSLQHESHTSGAVTQQAVSYPDFFDWRAQNHSFNAIASYRDNGHTLTRAGYAQNLSGETVSADFFRVLGVHPVLGRDFLAVDEEPGRHVVMLSHQLWESAFGANPQIIGHTIMLDGAAYTVAGIMPEGFAFPIQNPAPDLWVTLASDALDPDDNNPPTHQRGNDMLNVIGRQKPGVTIAQARAEMSVIDRKLAAQYPATNKPFTAVAVVPELESLIGNVRSALRILFAAVSFLLLIACANVAGLLLARVSRRQAEVALRSALGAQRTEIARQLLMEPMVLSLLGGLLGLVFSTLLLNCLLRFIPQDIPRSGSVSIDFTVLAFTCAVSVLTGLLFGVLPAWRLSRLDPALALRDSTRSVTAGRGQHRLHGILIVAETALGFVLLIGAGLFLHSFVHVLEADPGFNRHNVLVAGLNYPGGKDFPGKVTQFYSDLLPRIAALPGVQSVAAGWPLPFSGGGLGVSFDLEGRPQPLGESFSSRTTIVTPNFFHTLGIPILRGRAFTAADSSFAPPVVVINESFARKFFPGGNPIGKHIKPDLNDGVHFPVMREIVGVVGDVKLRSLTMDAPVTFYLPLAQMGIVSPNLVIRSKGDPVALIPAVRAQLNALDRTIPLFGTHTMEGALSNAAAQPRFQMLLLVSFALMALLLSAIGLYAVLSYMVVLRTNEMGLRLALGAQRGDVLRMVLQRGLLLAGIGIALGLAASTVLTRFVASLLYGVRAFDWPTYLSVMAIFMLIAAVASSGPAVCAANVDPGTTLREQ